MAEKYIRSVDSKLKTKAVVPDSLSLSACFDILEESYVVGKVLQARGRTKCSQGVEFSHEEAATGIRGLTADCVEHTTADSAKTLASEEEGYISKFHFLSNRDDDAFDVVVEALPGVAPEPYPGPTEENEDVAL
jgi:hypothetical protein